MTTLFNIRYAVPQVVNANKNTKHIRDEMTILVNQRYVLNNNQSVNSNNNASKPLR